MIFSVFVHIRVSVCVAFYLTSKRIFGHSPKFFLVHLFAVQLILPTSSTANHKFTKARWAYFFCLFRGFFLTSHVEQLAVYRNFSLFSISYLINKRRLDARKRKSMFIWCHDNLILNIKSISTWTFAVAAAAAASAVLYVCVCAKFRNSLWVWSTGMETHELSQHINNSEKLKKDNNMTIELFEQAE